MSDEIFGKDRSHPRNNRLSLVVMAPHRALTTNTGHSGNLPLPLGTRVRLRVPPRLGEFANRAHEKSSATTIRPTPSTSQPGRIISKSNALCSTLSGGTLAWMPSAIASPMNVSAAITPLSAINIHVGGSLRVLRHQTSIR